MDRKEAVCPRCDGKKFLRLDLGPSTSHFVRCHVCRAGGTVPFKSRDKAAEKKAFEARAAVVSAPQARLFDVTPFKKRAL